MIAERPARIYINGRFLQQQATGVQRYGRELLRAWDGMLARDEIDAADVTFEVLAPRGPIDPPKLERISIRQAGRLGGHFWTQIELPLLTRDGLLFSPGNIHPLLSFGRYRGVVTVHDLAYADCPEAYSSAFRALYSVLVPAALRRADAVITVSEAERTRILGRYPKVNGRIHAVHHGAPEGRIADGPPSERGAPRRERPFVLWVGTLIARKNPQGAIDAVALVNQETPLDLVLVGASQSGLLEGELRVQPDVLERLQFAGWVSGFAELRRLYQGAAALVFPSFYEGFGIPPLEAMRLGCPVIASDIPALREVCGDAVLYVDPRRPAEIARAIRRLMDDPALARALCERGMRRAAMFTWEKCARDTFGILARVLEQGRNRRGALGPASAPEPALRATK